MLWCSKKDSKLSLTHDSSNLHKIHVKWHRTVTCWIRWGPLLKHRCYYRTLPYGGDNPDCEDINHRQGISNEVQSVCRIQMTAHQVQRLIPVFLILFIDLCIMLGVANTGYIATPQLGICHCLSILPVLCVNTLLSVIQQFWFPTVTGHHYAQGRLSPQEPRRYSPTSPFSHPFPNPLSPPFPSSPSPSLSLPFPLFPSCREAAPWNQLGLQVKVNVKVGYLL